MSLGSPGKVPFVAPASSGDPGSLMQAERAAVKQSSRIYDIFPLSESEPGLAGGVGGGLSRVQGDKRVLF